MSSTNTPANTLYLNGGAIDASNETNITLTSGELDEIDSIIFFPFGGVNRFANLFIPRYYNYKSLLIEMRQTDANRAQTDATLSIFTSPDGNNPSLLATLYCPPGQLGYVPLGSNIVRITYHGQIFNTNPIVLNPSIEYGTVAYEGGRIASPSSTLVIVAPPDYIPSFSNNIGISANPIGNDLGITHLVSQNPISALYIQPVTGCISSVDINNNKSDITISTFGLDGNAVATNFYLLPVFE